MTQVTKQHPPLALHERAELEALRAAVDQAIRTLDSEADGPIMIDDGGAIREVVRHTAGLLKTARPCAA